MKELLPVKDIMKFVNDKVVVRQVNMDRAQRFAEKMKDGVEFPPIVIGHWPLDESHKDYKDSGIIDGMTRLAGASLAKLPEFYVSHMEYKNLSHALIDTVALNEKQGWGLDDSDRDARIKAIIALGEVTMEELGKQFHLHKSSISRIVKGTQTKGKRGKGAKKEKKGKKLETPVTGVQVKRFSEQLTKSLSKKSHIDDIVTEYVWEDDKGNGEVDTHGVKLLGLTITALSKLHDEIRAEMKRLEV